MGKPVIARGLAEAPDRVLINVRDRRRIGAEPHPAHRR